MINKLVWHGYDKPCFYSFKGEGKQHRGDGKEKIERKKGKGRSKKISPVLGPTLIQPADWGSRSWATLPDQSGGLSFKAPVSRP